MEAVDAFDCFEAQQNGMASKIDLKTLICSESLSVCYHSRLVQQFPLADCVWQALCPLKQTVVNLTLNSIQLSFVQNSFMCVAWFVLDAHFMLLIVVSC